jgi:hypothetical protein
MVEVYVRNINNRAIILNSDLLSLRFRQRARKSNGLKVEPFKFLSYKEAVKLSKKGRMYGPFDFNTISKL